MASKTKTGPLNKEEKLYIAERFLHPERTTEWIAEQLKRSESMVQKYIDKLKHEDKKDKKEKATESKIKKYQTGPATVLSEEAASLGIKSSKYESPYRYR